MAYLNKNGSFRTNSLFEETIKPDQKAAGIKPVMSLKDAREIYVKCADPTGYKAAMLICDGSWEQWERLKDWPRFANEILPGWERELEVKLRSDAICRLADVADDPRHSKHTDCAKWLAEGRWKTGPRGPGRPTDKERKERQDLDKEVIDRAKQDAKRLNLH